MARGRDGSAPRRRKRGVLRHYDRPLWRDRMFWVVALPSVVATAVIVGLLLLLWGVPDSGFAWVRIVVVGLIVLNLAFRVLGFSLVTTRHFQRGLGEGSTKRDGDWEDKGRAAGAVVGKAISKTRKATSATAAAAPRPRASDDRPPATPAIAASADDAVDAAASGTTGTEGPTLDDRVQPDPAPVAEATSAPSSSTSSSSPGAGTDQPSTKETVDKAARVVGGMVGRRLAERRRKQG
jgi:hypothetical protein